MIKELGIGTLPINESVVTYRAISLFKQVTNIPFALGYDADPKKLEADNAGCCARKHLYMAAGLARLGYKVDIGLVLFDWRQLPIPQEILKLLAHPIQNHMFLYLEREGKPMIIDATWDPGLDHLGFQVSEWDGLSSTGISVRPVAEPHKQNLMLLKTRANVSLVLQLLNRQQPNVSATPFNDAFNLWMANNRSL